MDKDQLTALAREYAEECIDPQGFSKSFYEELVDEKAENVAYVLRWLTNRFCLVEKSKVLKSLIQARALIEVGRRNHDNIKEDLGTGSERTIYCLFPEIAKEVKNEN